MKVEKYKDKYFDEINKIYIKSFPKSERYKDLDDFINDINNKKGSMFILIDDEKIVGFIYLIELENTVFILYLAITKEKRNSGYGSYFLKWCINNYKGKLIYLNVEEVDKKYEDYSIRKNRLNFYLKNGFKDTNYISKENIIFNILSNKEEINLVAYKKLDAYVAELLNDEKSNIVKKLK